MSMPNVIYDILVPFFTPLKLKLLSLIIFLLLVISETLGTITYNEKGNLEG